MTAYMNHMKKQRKPMLDSSINPLLQAHKEL